jgi:hypothetical protein
VCRRSKGSDKKLKLNLPFYCEQLQDRHSDDSRLAPNLKSEASALFCLLFALSLTNDSLTSALLLFHHSKISQTCSEIAIARDGQQKAPWIGNGKLKDPLTQKLHFHNSSQKKDIRVSSTSNIMVFRFQRYNLTLF